MKEKKILKIPIPKQKMQTSQEICQKCLLLKSKTILEKGYKKY